MDKQSEVATKKVTFTSSPMLNFGTDRVTNARGPNKFFEVATLAQKHKLALLASRLETVGFSRNVGKSAELMYQQDNTDLQDQTAFLASCSIQV